MAWLSQHVHLGDLPTWVAAIAAIIAGYFGFGQLKALRTQNQNQQRELDRQDEDIEQVKQTQRKQMELLDLEIRDRRAAQARQIVIQRIVEPWKEPGSVIVNGFALFIKVTNNSHGAISDIDGYFTFNDMSPERGTYSLREPRTNAELVAARKKHGPVPAERLDPGSTLRIVGPTYDELKANGTRGELLFTDSDGRRWKSSHTGQLSEITPPDPAAGE